MILPLGCFGGPAVHPLPCRCSRYSPGREPQAGRPRWALPAVAEARAVRPGQRGAAGQRGCLPLLLQPAAPPAAPQGRAAQPADPAVRPCSWPCPCSSLRAVCLHRVSQQWDCASLPVERKGACHPPEMRCLTGCVVGRLQLRFRHLLRVWGV